MSDGTLDQSSRRHVPWRHFLKSKMMSAESGGNFGFGTRSQSMDGSFFKEDLRRSSLTPEVLKTGMDCLANSQSDITQSKFGMESIIERERRLIRDYELRERSSSTPDCSLGMDFEGHPLAQRDQKRHRSLRIGANFRRWLILRLETGKNRKRAMEDVKKAHKAMSTAEDMLLQMEKALDQEEEFLHQRADQLRRQSVELFKVVKQPSSGNDYAYDNRAVEDLTDSDEDNTDFITETSEVKVDQDEDSSSLSVFNLNLGSPEYFHQNADGFLEHLETPTEQRTFDYLIEDSSTFSNDKEECHTKL
ncbi:hypothetical protein TCAL_03727 [Tigriopus californicus]|uniref:Uncharacterized protein n=1 Tax=Tigriopus californicus TaxID=6832 RepID=A0A553NNW6_TIGCA|nr:uncharacterized protein LOC131878795 [Tigriopus californicus]TRY67131.1 hypothetical protein TCAL_03727 [Tigriopus californicus]